MYSTRQIKVILKKSIPELSINSVEYLDEGSSNEAYEVNKAYIFRFPVNSKASMKLYREIEILPLIERSLNLLIPHFDYIGEKSAVFDKYFVGYKKIHGTSLSCEKFEQLTSESQDRMIRELAIFFDKLHRFPVTDIPVSLTKSDYKFEYENIYQKIEKKIWPEPFRNEQKIIRTLLGKFLDNLRNFAYRPCLLHNDISDDHIFYDPAASCLTGIIDFGEMIIGDGVYDFRRIMDTYGFLFLRKLLDDYQPDNSQASIKKLLYYRLMKETGGFLHKMEKGNSHEIKKRLPFLQRCIKDCLEKAD